MHSMSLGRERAIFCLIILVKYKKERPTGHSSVEVGHPGPDMSASDYFVSSIFGRSKIIGGMASNDIAAIASIVISIP